MQFRLDKVIASRCEKVVRAAASELASAKPRVKHRSKRSGPVGGKLVAALRRAKSLVRQERWGAVIEWAKLGPTFLFLTKGTPRQRARPVNLAPDEADLRADVSAAGEEWARKRDRRRGRR